MATIKAFTDLPQSKKLASFLSLKSADMHYERAYFEGKQSDWFVKLGSPIKSDDILPCWSLATLLDILESEIDGEEGETYQLNIEKDGTWWNVWYRERYDEANPIETESTEDLVDACVAMIENLHEQNLL